MYDKTHYNKKKKKLNWPIELLVRWKESDGGPYTRDSSHPHMPTWPLKCVKYNLPKVMNRIPKNNRQKKNQTQSLSSTFAQKVYKIYFLGYAYQKTVDFHTVFKTRVFKFQINTNSKNQLPKEKKKMCAWEIFKHSSLVVENNFTHSPSTILT